MPFLPLINFSHFLHTKSSVKNNDFRSQNSSFFFSIPQFQAIELKFIQNCTNFNESLSAHTSIEETRNEREREVINFGWGKWNQPRFIALRALGRSSVITATPFALTLPFTNSSVPAMIAKVLCLGETKAFEVLKRGKLSRWVWEWERVVEFANSDDDFAMIWEAPLSKLLIPVEMKIGNGWVRDILQLIDRFTLAIFVIITDASLSIKPKMKSRLEKHMPLKWVGSMIWAIKFSWAVISFKLRSSTYSLLLWEILLVELTNISVSANCSIRKSINLYNTKLRYPHYPSTCSLCNVALLT